MAESTKERKGAESFTVEGIIEEIKPNPPFININFFESGIQLASNLSRDEIKEILIEFANKI